ncbi:MAG: laccase domain-containing protein, partial [Sedimenticola sp.]
MNDWIYPDWPAPAGVRAVITTRQGGVSRAPYESMNLGDHVGDDPVAVRRNREFLAESLELPSTPLWLNQVHGCTVASCGTDREGVAADAVVASQRGQVCAVLTADCLPLLLCNRQGDRVAAVHAGWRGLAAGVIEAA